MSYASARQTITDSTQQYFRRLRRMVAGASAFPGYALSRLPVAGELIAALAPAKAPPVLLVSMPRAGSSWVGRILGSSEGALYLREPLNQPYLERCGKNARSSVFEFAMCSDKESYAHCAALSFKGIPRFNQGIVQYPEQWSVGARSRKQVVVKEINPLIVEYLWELYRPKIVFLLRHPAPVVRSFDVLGWQRDQFEVVFPPDRLAALEQEFVIPRTTDFWEQGGAFHAIMQNRVMGFLAKVDHTVVRYEDVCENPLREFSRVFDFCGLPLSADLRQEIVRSSQSETTDYVPGRFDTVRNSGDMSSRWKSEIDADKVDRLRRSYFANRPLFYTEERDW